MRKTVQTYGLTKQSGHPMRCVPVWSRKYRRPVARTCAALTESKFRAATVPARCVAVNDVDAPTEIQAILAVSQEYSF